MFDAFEDTTVTTPRGDLHARIGGAGPPLLLLHGWPETHLMWHPVASALAESFTVVATDLPGYGQSFRPEPADDHAPHSKRALAADHVAAMASLGFDAFPVAGHDRGARVALRMALDHPGVVERLVAIDIVPGGEVWRRADANLALTYWHWSFLAQAAPLPEELILGAPDSFWIAAERQGLGQRAGRYPDEVLAAYRAQLRDPGAVQAMCEDYRAGAGIDRDHEDADRGSRTVACPTRVLWGTEGALPSLYGDPLEPWRPLAPDATGRGIDAGHFVVEDAPDAVLEELRSFLA